MKKLILLICLSVITLNSLIAQTPEENSGTAVVTSDDSSKGYYNPETEYFNLGYDARRYGKYIITGITPPIILLF